MMIKKIIFSLFVICLIVAIILKNLGYERVDMGSAFLSLLKTTNMQLNEFKIEIPKIPEIPKVSELHGFEIIVNAFVTFVNGISFFINALIGFVNLLIQFWEFVGILISNLFKFSETVTPAEDDFPYINQIQAIALSLV